MEALILALTKGDGLILAGGHSLLPALAVQGRRYGRLIDIGRIASLKSIRSDDDQTVIGAGVTLSELLRSSVALAFPAMAQAIAFVGNHVVRNRSTVGGNVAWADPRGELLLILIAYDAKVVTNKRTLDAEDFAAGFGGTVLGPDEVILEVRLRPPARVAFDEVLARNSTGRAVVSAACALAQDGSVQLSLGGLVDRPLRSPALHCRDEVDFVDAAAAFLDAALARYPVLPDAMSIDYRRAIAPRLLRRCFQRVSLT